MTNKVYLYHFKIPSNLQIDPENILSSDQALVFSKISHLKRNNEYLFSRLLLNHVLGSIHKRDISKIRKSKSGKPLIPGLYFNLSHSGDRILLAVSEKYSVGIDVERSESKKSFKRIAEKYFSPVEYKFITAVKSEKAQFKKFKILWSLKESYVKALGLSLNKKNIQIHFSVKSRKIDKFPVKKKVTVFFDEKNYLALTVVGAVTSSQLKVTDFVYSEKKSFQEKKSKIQLVMMNK